MPRHVKHLALAPIDPPPDSVVEGDELGEGVKGMAEACEFLGGISERQMHTLIRNGRVKPLQDGPKCRLYFPKRRLVEYLRTLGSH